MEILNQIKDAWRPAFDEAQAAVDFPTEIPLLPPFPGDSYRYVVNCREGRLERVDAAVEAVLGYRPAEFDLPLLLSLATALLLLAWVRLTRRWMGTARPFFF